MKKLLLCMIVMASLVSCGKDNKVSSGSTTNTVVTNPIAVNNSAAQALISQINNYSTGFGNGVINTSSSTQECETKWGGFLQWCYSKPGTSSSITWNAVVAQTPTLRYVYSNYETVIHNQVVISTKQNEILNLVQSATNITAQPVSGGNVYYIYVSGGLYVIDTRYPIQANPSAVQTGSVYKYLFTAQPN